MLLLLRPLFFFNAPAPSPIYTLSLHDALPIYRSDGEQEKRRSLHIRSRTRTPNRPCGRTMSTATRITKNTKVAQTGEDRKSTRLNSSHVSISYAVFCLKKKKKTSTSNNTKQNK